MLMEKNKLISKIVKDTQAAYAAARTVKQKYAAAKKGLNILESYGYYISEIDLLAQMVVDASKQIDNTKGK